MSVCLCVCVSVCLCVCVSVCLSFYRWEERGVNIDRRERERERKREHIMWCSYASSPMPQSINHYSFRRPPIPVVKLLYFMANSNIGYSTYSSFFLLRSYFFY